VKATSINGNKKKKKCNARFNSFNNNTIQTKNIGKVNDNNIYNTYIANNWIPTTNSTFFNSTSGNRNNIFNRNNNIGKQNNNNGRMNNNNSDFNCSNSNFKFFITAIHRRYQWQRWMAVGVEQKDNLLPTVVTTALKLFNHCYPLRCPPFLPLPLPFLRVFEQKQSEVAFIHLLHKLTKKWVNIQWRWTNSLLPSSHVWQTLSMASIRHSCWSIQWVKRKWSCQPKTVTKREERVVT